LILISSHLMERTKRKGETTDPKPASSSIDRLRAPSGLRTGATSIHTSPTLYNINP
jgi:hypothetical protein